MRKYLALCKTAFIQSFTFRAELLLWILLDIFPTIILSFVWITLYQQKTVIGQFTLSQMLTYYFALSIVNNISSTHFESWWSAQVTFGNIDTFFTKPINFFANMWVRQIGQKILPFFVFLIPFLLIFGAFSLQGNVSLPTFTFEKLLWFLVFVTLGFLINVLLSSFVVLAAFWMQEAGSITHFFMMMSGIFGGFLAPLTFYPPFLQRIATYLPFKSIISTPAEILSRDALPQTMGHEVVLVLGYIVVGTLLLFLLWEQAKKAYTSAGG